MANKKLRANKNTIARFIKEITGDWSDYPDQVGVFEIRCLGEDKTTVSQIYAVDAVVEATDVRPETKEQVESLGAKFIEVPLTDDEQELAKGEGGYAKEMSEDYKQRQADLIAERLKQADIVITTALIPGKSAPVLVTEAMVKSMKPGSVIVDMAAEQGGNCPLTQANKVSTQYGVTLIGSVNIPSSVASDASSLYAKNLLNFMELITNQDNGSFALNLEDEIVSGTLVSSNSD